MNLFDNTCYFSEEERLRFPQASHQKQEKEREEQGRGGGQGGLECGQE